MKMKNIIVIFVMLLVSSLAFAQEDIIREIKREKNGKEKDLGVTGKIYTRELPKTWSIKKEVKIIEKSLGDYDPLINSLEEANSDLKLDLAAYLKNPKDQVLAAKITAKMASYAGKIVTDVDKIISNQDMLLSVFNELNRKLVRYNSKLDIKVIELADKMKKAQFERKAIEKQLKSLASKIKESKDPKEKEHYRREFRRIHNKYNIKRRYESGYARNKRDYETLSKNLKSLVKMFSILKEAFANLLENLEAEKNYLLDNIRLQADAIKIQKLVHEGISDGSRAVAQITKKLALVYAKVESFAKVQEKINRDMARFSDTTKVLSSLVQQVEKAPYNNAPTLDSAIDYWYSVRNKEE